MWTSIVTLRPYLRYSVHTMIQSMTGFGSAEKGGYRVDIRSLNHRYLEITVKMPPQFFEMEMAFRAAIKERFSRGKFDVVVTLSADAAADIRVDEAAAARVCRSMQELQRSLGIPGQLDIRVLAGFHPLFMGADAKRDSEAAHDAFREAAGNLTAMRQAEGAALGSVVVDMVDRLAAMRERIREESAETVADVAGRLNERLRTMLEGRDIDENRILQEASVVAMRYDVSEEIDRLDCHIRQFRNSLAAGGAVGRKLDFLVQEMNREVNTIASKSPKAAVVQETVEMKALIERIREQVQNIQ